MGLGHDMARRDAHFRPAGPTVTPCNADNALRVRKMAGHLLVNKTAVKASPRQESTQGLTMTDVSPCSRRVFNYRDGFRFAVAPIGAMDNR